eukprot:10224977-Alexandrium_andersonii.AAC.1
MLLSGRASDGGAPAAASAGDTGRRLRLWLLPTTASATRALRARARQVGVDDAAGAVLSGQVRVRVLALLDGDAEGTGLRHDQVAVLLVDELRP